MDAFDWISTIWRFPQDVFCSLAFLVRPLKYLLDLSGHINEVNFKKEINTLGSALKGLFNKKRKSILTEQIEWPYNKIDGGIKVVALL